MSILRYALLAPLCLALFLIWGAAAAANFAHGIQFAGNSPWWLVFGAISAAGDIIKAYAFLGGSSAWDKGRYVALTCCVLVWIPATAWSVYSCYSFVATVQSDNISGRDMHKTADNSLLAQIASQVKRVDTLQDLKIKAPAKDWDRIEREIGLVEDRLEKLRARARTTQTVGSSYAIGDTLKRWGVDPERVKDAQLIVFLLLVELGSNIGLLAFKPLFGAKHEEQIAQAQAQVLERVMPLQQPAVAIETGAGPGVLPKISTAKFEAPSPRPSPRQRVGGGAPKAPDGVHRRPPTSRTADMALAGQAAELLRRLENGYGEGAAIVSNAVFKAYHDLCRERSWQPMTSKGLQKQLAAIGVSMTDPDDSKRTHYVLPTALEKGRGKGPRQVQA